MFPTMSAAPPLDGNGISFHNITTIHQYFHFFYFILANLDTLHTCIFSIQVVNESRVIQEQASNHKGSDDVCILYMYVFPLNRPFFLLLLILLVCILCFLILACLF